MKFSTRLQMEAYPAWSTHYISYTSLRKLIDPLTRASADDSLLSELDLELSLAVSDADRPVILALDNELKNVADFYRQTEAELQVGIKELLSETILLPSFADPTERANSLAEKRRSS